MFYVKASQPCWTGAENFASCFLRRNLRSALRSHSSVSLLATHLRMTIYREISYFKTLENTIKLHSFLPPFYPDLLGHMHPLQNLLKKDIAFVWPPEHQAAFNTLKTKMKTSMELRYFDPSIPTSLVMDANCLHGRGFALIQTDVGPPQDIQRGSHRLRLIKLQLSSRA